jgi:PA14 domain
MRSLLPKIIVVALAVVLCTAIAGLGEDYLVIKKKGGPTQKVPLNFAPDQIESFHVESAPGAKSGEAAPGAESAQGTKEAQGGAAAKQPEGKPLEIRPGAPPSSPTVQQKRPGMAPPSIGPGPGHGLTEEGKGAGLQQPPTGAKPAPPRKSVSGPVAAALPGGKGTFTLNIYKLPDNIKALPDYSAFKPVQTLTCDRINLDPSKGDNEPSGLPEKKEGLGMRFVGMFMVSGEGIFKWRLYSKDGSRMNVDDKTLIENDGIHDASSKTGYVHLGEGVHTIIVDSFNSQGPPVLQLFVQPPIGNEQIFSLGTGLAGWKEPAKPYDVLWGQAYFVPKGNYPEGPDFNQLSPIGRIIAPELNISGGEGFPGLPGRKEMVGIHYQGFFNVQGAGIFAFRLLADHFARLTIGKQNVVDITGGAKADQKGKLGWAFLQKGSYPITVDYFNSQGDPHLELYVTPPTQKEELFSPSRTLVGFSSEEGKVSLIPAFVYFLKPNTKRMPNYNKLSPSGMFFTKAIDYLPDRGTREFPGVPKRENWLGLRFYVKFSLSDKEAGSYKFRIVCGDAARLIIGKKIIINAEGGGKTVEQAGTATMEAGSHEMFLDYFQGTGPSALQLFITPPGGQEKVFAFQ